MNCPAEFENKTTVNPWALVLGGGLLWAISALIVFAILRPLLPPKDWGDVYGLSEKLALGVCLLYFAREIGISFSTVIQDWWKNRARHLRIVGKYFIVYAGFMVLAVGALVALLIILEKTGRIDPAATAELTRGMDPGDKTVQLRLLLGNSIPRFILSLFSMCVIAPIIEEIFFRRFLFVALRKKYNFIPALLVTSLLFMAVHPNMALGAIGGIYLGYVYEKGKSLPANILIHGLVNFTVTAVSMVVGQ